MFKPNDNPQSKILNTNCFSNSSLYLPKANSINYTILVYHTNLDYISVNVYNIIMI